MVSGHSISMPSGTIFSHLPALLTHFQYIDVCVFIVSSVEEENNVHNILFKNKE